MAHAEDGFSKFDYARFAAAAVAVLAHRQGDAVGLWAVNDRASRMLPPRRDHQHLHRLLHELERLEPAGAWPAWERLEGAFAAGERGLVLLVSDLHERAAELTGLATKLAALRHEVLVFHVMGRVELEGAWHGTVSFEELETGRRLEVDADAARPAYRAALERELARIRRTLEERGVAYARLALDQPLDLALRHFLTARARLP
jgi:uncharacterized protein (DUF58 family)